MPLPMTSLDADASHVNALSPILVTEFGSISSSIVLQYPIANADISVSVSGRVMLLSDSQLRNTCVPIFVIPLGIDTILSALSS